MVYTKKGSFTPISKTHDIPDWVKEYAKKIAVQPIRNEEEKVNLYDQISSVITNHYAPKKHNSVQAAVQDMMERSGLIAYKQKIAAKIIAEANIEENSNLPALFQICPEAESTFKNFVSNTHGTLPILSIIEKVKSIHKNDVKDEGLWNDQKLYKYVFDLNKSNKQDFDVKHTNLGHNRVDDDVDPANYDAFHSLMPANVK